VTQDRGVPSSGPALLHPDAAFGRAVAAAIATHEDPVARAAAINGIITMHMLQVDGVTPAGLGVARAAHSQE